MKPVFPSASKRRERKMKKQNKRIVFRLPIRVKILGILSKPRIVMTEAITYIMPI